MLPGSRDFAGCRRRRWPSDASKLADNDSLPPQNDGTQRWSQTSAGLFGESLFYGVFSESAADGGESLPPSLLSFDDPLGLAFLFRGIRRIHFCISPPMPLVRRYRLAEDRDLEARVNKRPKVTPPSLGGSIV
jgi:hypothetical protein